MRPIDGDKLRGHLEMLILATLERDPAHGLEILRRLETRGCGLLKLKEGSLYPALYRLELDGAVSAYWGLSDNNRKAKYYEITKRGRKLISEQHEAWDRLSAAVDRVLARQPQ
jgi:PadR family transcriptional regulator, regulatory protein PadR